MAKKLNMQLSEKQTAQFELDQNMIIFWISKIWKSGNSKIWKFGNSKIWNLASPILYIGEALNEGGLGSTKAY